MQFRAKLFLFFLVAGITGWFGCSFGHRYQVVYVSEYDGIYVYDVARDTSWQLVSFEQGQPVIVNSLKVIDNDWVVLGFHGDEKESFVKAVDDKTAPNLHNSKDSSAAKSNSPSREYNNYFSYWENHIAFNIDSKEQYLYQTKQYRLFNRETLTIILTTFSPKGDTLSVSDTSYPCTYYRYTNNSRWIEFCDSYDRFYSESDWVKGKQAFSRKGSIYLRDGGKEKLILEPEFGFDGKFGAGLFEPNISADGEKAIVRYNPGFLNGLDCVREIDLDTGKDTVVVYGTFFYPKYSQDSRYILFKNEQNEGYLYEPETKKFTYVGFGEMFVFR